MVIPGGSTLTVVEQYRELKDDMGLPVWQILRRLDLSAEALSKQLYRNGLPVPQEVSDLICEERAARKRTQRGRCDG